MATKEFIFQGFTDRTHGAAVKDLFKVGKVEAVSVSVAFVNEGGVEHIEEALKPHAKQTRVFAGVRNEISSYQGLSRLYGLIGSGLHTVDTASRLLVFHPKFFIVRGDKRARMIIGSANLTLGGLNNNIEASLLVDCDLADKADAELVYKVESSLDAIVKEHPEHVVAVSSQAVLDAMLKAGRLIDETALPPPRPRTSAGGSADTDTLKRIALKVPRIKRPVTKAAAPAAAPAKAKSAKPAAAAKGAAAAVPVPATIGVDFELVWESESLMRRDLNVPDGDNTAATGSINLDKGLLTDDVDFRHYFREEVFPALAWAPGRSAGVHEAQATVQLVIKGLAYGEFQTRVAHTISSTSRSYLQKNAMTRLSWGAMKPYVAREDLIGRNLALYRDKADPTRFVVEID